MSDDRVLKAKITWGLLVSYVKLAWSRRRDNIYMRRHHQGSHRLQENTYYGHSASAIVLRLRGERPLFAALHEKTETVVLV